MLTKRIFLYFSKGHKVLKGYLIPPAPTRPPSAFLIYYRQLNGQPNQPKVTATIAAKNWKLLSSAEKALYEAAYRQSNSQYSLTLTSYNQKFLDGFKYEPFGYQLFVRQTYKKARLKAMNLPSTEIFKLLAKQWADLTEQEKKKFDQEAKNEAEEGKQMKENKLENIKEYKIPEMEKGIGRPSLEQIMKHKQEIKDFCIKHKITVEELENLLDPSKNQSKQKIEKKQKFEKTSQKIEKQITQYETKKGKDEVKIKIKQAIQPKPNIEK